jgi:hypothetical protein
VRRALLLTVLALPAYGDWQFAPPLVVTAGSAGVFPHLEAAGRASLAVAADGSVALVWEDNRSGAPQVYGAIKGPAAGQFTTPRRLSEGAQAYEPAVAPLAGGAFVVAMEQDRAVWLRRFDAEGAEAPQRVAAEAAQPTLAGGLLAWVAGERVMVARLDAAGVPVGPPYPADAAGGPQLYPALARVGSAAVIAWEDRRHGHTRLLTASERAGRVAGPLDLNERPPSNGAGFGRGTGVTRVALDAAGDTVAAVWMDKRAFQGGYDIYAAVSGDGGRRFAANELVQDLFGENTPQWHPDIAVAADGRIVAAWDDPRDGTPDVWLSWREAAGEWSADLTAPMLSGPGAQTHPVVAFDADGRLHLAWIDRPDDGAPSIWYTRGEWVPQGGRDEVLQ